MNGSTFTIGPFIHCIETDINLNNIPRLTLILNVTTGTYLKYPPKCPPIKFGEFVFLPVLDKIVS